MTLVTGTVQDLGYDGMEGTLWARPARFRSDGQVVLAPERKPFKITGGVVSAELAPGPAVLELQVGSHARGTFEVVIPEEDTTLADLLDTVFPWEPAQVSLFVAEREAAQQAKADAEQAATLAGTAKTGAELAAQQTGQDRTAVAADKQVVVGHVQALAAPNDAAVLGLISEGATTQTKAALNDTYVLESSEDVRKHGVVMGSTADAAPALNAAADAARAASRPLFIPPGTIYIDSTVNLRGLDVIARGRIFVRHTNAVGVIVGDVATQRNSRRIDMTWVQHSGTTILMWDWPHPAVRVIGLKGATVRIGTCSLMELYADAAVAADDSTAYNTLELGRINHLRLHGVNGDGWVNQNLFIGGSYNRITISGSYSHNNNKWLLPSVEGAESLMDFQVGAQNVLEDARAEGGTKVKFGAGTWRNTASALYTSNQSVLYAFVVESDLGRENQVTSRDLQQMSTHTIFKIDPSTPLFDTASPGLMVDPVVNGMPIPSVGGGALAIRTQNRNFIDTGRLKVDEVTGTGGSMTLDPPSRVRRFLLTCDASILRPNLYGYDANGNQLDPAVTPWMDLYGSWSIAATDGGRYQSSAPFSSFVITISNPAVKYIRLVLFSSLTTQPLFRHITLTAYIEGSVNTHLVQTMRNTIYGAGGMFATAKPSEGVAKPGTIVVGTTDSWKAIARVGTTLTVAADTAALTVANGTGIAVGDVIGVLLDSGRTHWSTVSAISGTAITLAAPVPTPAAVGAAVSTTRWGVL